MVFMETLLEMATPVLFSKINLLCTASAVSWIIMGFFGVFRSEGMARMMVFICFAGLIAMQQGGSVELGEALYDGLLYIGLGSLIIYGLWKNHFYSAAMINTFSKMTIVGLEQEEKGSNPFKNEGDG